MKYKNEKKTIILFGGTLALAVTALSLGYAWPKEKEAHYEAEGLVAKKVRSFTSEAETYSTYNGTVDEPQSVWDADPAVNNAFQLLADRKYEEARNLLMKISEAQPDNVKVLRYILATYTADNPDWGKASDLCERIIQIDPNVSGIFERYRGIILEANTIDRGIDFLQALVGSALENPDLAEVLGQLQANKNAFSDAIQSMEKAVEGNPSHKELILRDIADLHLKQNQLPEARSALLRAVNDVEAANSDPNTPPKQRKNDIPILYRLIALDIELKDLESAASQLETLLASDPTDPKLLFYKSRIANLKD